jgi:Outer membrane protein and related peptidoglycan-associated (lipo)proteins
MNLKKSTGLAVLAFFLLFDATSEVLTWRANAGQQYGTKTTIKETVTALDSITSKPVLITEDAPMQEVAAENKSTIPHLHGIPSFPRNAINPGDVWTEKASISYDLSGFGLPDSLTVEMPVHYTFLEMSEIDSRSYYHIRAEWYPFFIMKGPEAKRSGIIRLSGASSMDLFWDNKSGSPKRSNLTEELQFRFDGNRSLLHTTETTEEFKTVTDIVRERVIKQLTEQIATQQVANVEVKQSEEGIVLSIDNIQFEAESAVLADTEKAKLTNVGKLLASLTDRKLSVIGHAANPAGSDEAELQALSQTRAEAVAAFMVESGIKTADMIVATGMGGSKPLASNDTPEGRSKNRRVEIVIMDKEVQE